MEPAVPDDFDLARSRLRPSLRTRVQYAHRQLEAQLQGGHDDPLGQGPHREIFGDLLWTIVCEAPPTAVEVTHAQLRRWGIDADQGFAVALENLRRHTSEAMIRDATGVFVSPWRDGYDCARILLPDTTTGVPPGGVVMLAHPRYLLAADPDNHRAFGAMLDFTGELAERDPPLLGRALWRTETGWQPYPLEADHPLFASARHFVLLDHVLSCLPQAQMLRALPDRDPDVEVLDLGVIAIEDEIPTIQAIWSGSERAWVPKVDDLAIYPDRGPSAQVCWEGLVDVLGDEPGQLVPQGLWPQRYELLPLRPKQLRALRKWDPDVLDANALPETLDIGGPTVLVEETEYDDGEYDDDEYDDDEYDDE